VELTQSRNIFNTFQVRETILELICEVGDCLKQSKLTIHLAVEYMDRIILLRNHFAGVMT